VVVSGYAWTVIALAIGLPVAFWTFDQVSWIATGKMSSDDSKSLTDDE
jgi:hypothetical protein